MHKINVKWCLLVLALFIQACATSPTGRGQVILYSDAQLAEMGQQAFAGMKQELAISDKRMSNSMVQCIANELLRFVDDSVFSGDWEVVVFDDNQVNAFALPGGKIGVYTGLLGVAENQHQVAAVVGHEIGHVIARHGNERMSNSALINMGQQAVGQILVANEVASTPAIMQALGLGSQLGSLKYSRVHESEADKIGLELMARAGFDPTQSINLWQNMSKLGDGNRPPEFLSTHPTPDTRIDALKADMPNALKIYQAAGKKPNCK